MILSSKPGPIKGISYLIKGFKSLTMPGIRKFVVVPVSINLIIFATLTWWVVTTASDQASIMVEQWLPDWLDWLSYAILPFMIILLLAILFFCFSIITNLLAAPFNGLLAEAVESRLTGQRFDGGFKQLLKDSVITIGSELRKLFYILVRIIPLLVLLLVPVVGAALWLLFSAWMAVITFMDYPMGNHSIHFSKQRVILGQYRTMCLGFGFATVAATAIPVVNFVVMPAAVVGATLMWIDHFKTTALEHKTQSGKDVPTIENK